jgi:hypothetical protein
MLVFAGLIASCNLPGTAPPSEVSSDAVYTMAAETVMAYNTQEAVALTNAVESSKEGPTITAAKPTSTKGPTISPEPTHTLTLTETPTQTPIPDAILEDDFSNASLWYVALEDDYGFEYQNGSYRIYNELLNAAIWSIKYQDFQDIRVEVDAIRSAGPEDGYYGVLCRFENEGDDYYALVINDSGFYGILKMENGDKEFLETGFDENDIIKKGEGETNRIQGVCKGDHLILYVNRQKILEVVDDSLTEGTVGLVAGNGLKGVGIDVAFDNFTLLWP